TNQKRDVDQRTSKPSASITLGPARVHGVGEAAIDYQRLGLRYGVIGRRVVNPIGESTVPASFSSIAKQRFGRRITLALRLIGRLCRPRELVDWRVRRRRL